MATGKPIDNKDSDDHVKILALDTSATPGSLALLTGEQIVYEAALPDQRRTTESFASEIQRALQACSWSPREVELLGICAGPGSFTGLRIGATVAKTYAYATGCNVIALDTLDVLAAQPCVSTNSLWVVLDAQRQQLFAAQYDASDLTQTPRRLTKTRIVDARPFLAARTTADLLTGSGLHRWAKEVVTPVSAPTSWSINAAKLGQLTRQAYQRGERTDIWQLTPDYGRASAAEEKRTSEF